MIVSQIHGFEPPIDRPAIELFDLLVEPLMVQFKDRTARLDRTHPQFAALAEILGDLHGTRLPVYAEIDADDRMIDNVLVPVEGKVMDLVTHPSGDVTFRLDAAAKPFQLSAARIKTSWWDALDQSQRKRTPVLVTEREDIPEIVDIRPMEVSPGPAAAPVPTARREAARPAAQPVTEQRARALFGMLHARSCRPEHPTAPCIPFLYVRDGCHARCHEMCRLIKEAGEQPGKVWNYSNLLVVKTVNEPGCEATWKVHVAPTLEVVIADGTGVQMMVIDPSLFSHPVPVAEWQQVQGDPESILLFTSAEPFLPPVPGDVEDDPENNRTKTELARYRNKFKRRVAKEGPPPYRCPH